MQAEESESNGSEMRDYNQASKQVKSDRERQPNLDSVSKSKHPLLKKGIPTESRFKLN